VAGDPEKPSPASKEQEPKEAGSLTLMNESGKVTTLSAAAFAKLPRQTLKVKDHSGTVATYEGTSLAEVLGAAQVTLGKNLKGPLLANCLLVEAVDGYRVVFSLPEIDPENTDHMVLVADRINGQPLDAKHGPYRLVVPHDKRFSRWVRQVSRISVRSTAAAGTRAKGDKAGR
jgi:DMSO/TMAO reductase YedYZ molybdopterin-dependent catalytic subunit